MCRYVFALAAVANLKTDLYKRAVYSFHRDAASDFAPPSAASVTKESAAAAEKVTADKAAAHEAMVAGPPPP